jgi:putative Holliday junction resolvase
VTGVVVGLPLDQEGAEAEAATAARALAADIARHSGQPVELWDERLTTARALRAVQAMGGSTKGRKDDVDALAATVLLQHYLDAKRGSAT